MLRNHDTHLCGEKSVDIKASRLRKDELTGPRHLNANVLMIRARWRQKDLLSSGRDHQDTRCFC